MVEAQEINRLWGACELGCRVNSIMDERLIVLPFTAGERDAANLAYLQALFLLSDMAGVGWRRVSGILAPVGAPYLAGLTSSGKAKAIVVPITLKTDKEKYLAVVAAYSLLPLRHGGLRAEGYRRSDSSIE